MDYPILELNGIVRHHLIHDVGLSYPPIDWNRLGRVQDFDPSVFAAASGVLGMLESTKLKAAEFALAKTAEPLTYTDQLKLLREALQKVNKPLVILHKERNYAYMPKFALVLNLVELFGQLRRGKVRLITDLLYPHLGTNVDIIFTVMLPELPASVTLHADYVIKLESYAGDDKNEISVEKARGPDKEEYWLIKAILNDGFVIKSTAVLPE